MAMVISVRAHTELVFDFEVTIVEECILLVALLHEVVTLDEHGHLHQLHHCFRKAQFGDFKHHPTHIHAHSFVPFALQRIQLSKLC